MFQSASPTVIIDATLYVLIVFSVATWTLVFVKSWQFWTYGRLDREFGDTFWNTCSLQEAGALPDATFKGPQARIARQGLAWLAVRQGALGQTLKFQGQADELLEHALVAQMQQEERVLESGLTLLASISSTAPFDGLFGTVLGIMHALRQITASGSTSLDVVAGPIGDALVATAVGIAVAVPAVLAYNFFLRRAKLHRVDLENFVTSFVQVALHTGR